MAQPSGQGAVDARTYLALQPPETWNAGFLDEIRARVATSDRKLAVLDDDPTGVQSVHGVPVLTVWEKEDLRWAFRQPSPTFFVLTNSRSLPEGVAQDLNREIARRLVQVASETGVGFSVTSRSDSTLRGHYPAEPDALRAALESAGYGEVDGVVLCPCFLEAGRLTVDDVHWLREGERLIPVGLTEYASDANFGYSSSNLAAWVEEKTAGGVRAHEVVRVGLRDIRVGGPGRVAELLAGVKGGRTVVVNAASYADLEVFVLGLLEAEAAGKRFLYRTGPSFVRARGGIAGHGPVGPGELYARRPKAGNGLVIVGSHVETTTQQLAHALSLWGLQAVELSVRRVLDPSDREGELRRVVGEVERALPETDVVVYTSRELLGESGKGFGVGRAVSDALVEVVGSLREDLPLGFVVAKGGITSSNIGTRALGVRRAEVAGTVLPGIVSVWILPEGSRYPGLPYVIFPGNVGDPTALSRVVEILRKGAAPSDKAPVDGLGHRGTEVGASRRP